MAVTITTGSDSLTYGDPYRDLSKPLENIEYYEKFSINCIESTEPDAISLEDLKALVEIVDKKYGGKEGITITTNTSVWHGFAIVVSWTGPENEEHYAKRVNICNEGKERRRKDYEELKKEFSNE